jgi:signal transduction histidine kinase/CheY-like chemotaxis protein/predicted  nucleic acid-binding Zn-ribbon protein
MLTTSENGISHILGEIGRGSSLETALGLIADQLAAEIGAPTCKIWVVKRGDICDRCPLAHVCTNRQMCMHLVAASGATMQSEYPRIPLSVFTAPLITRGGTSDFSDSNGTGDKLFGVQRDASHHGSDSYALYPLRGASGTVGLIGVFNRRRFSSEDLRTIEELAPAAVAAIRVAELASRYSAVRARLQEDQTASHTTPRANTARENELEDAVAELTRQAAHLQVERESLLKIISHLEENNRETSARFENLTEEFRQQAQNDQSDLAQRRLEENAQLASRLSAIEAASGELENERGTLLTEMEERTQQVEQLKAHLSALQERNSALEVTNVMLRGENASVADTTRDLEHSLRMAEDRRSRLEKANLILEERVNGLINELDHLRVESNRTSGENEQLVAETERLNIEIERLRGGGTRISEDNARLLVLNAELSQAQARAESRLTELQQQHSELNTQLEESRALVGGRLVELEQENALLLQTRAQLEGEIARLTSRTGKLETENADVTQMNAQLQHAVAQFESLSARLEDSALKLRSRAEASETARAELEQRNRVLAEQNRRLSLEGQTKARFLANMSHELRTPMNAIIGFTSLMLDDRSLQLNDRHRRSLERVSRNARDLLELINNVLDLSKIEAGRMDIYSEPADLEDLIERALAVVESLKEARPITLSYRVEDGLPAMRTDRTKLQQILINLLSNAIKFTEHGEVKVTAERVGSDRVCIAVTDTGVGIAEADIAKIFEEFRQAGATGRGATTGTGLGLAITRRLVELMSGELSVSSREGQGSVFAVTLPLTIEGRIAATAEAESPLTDPDRTALVIDGDPASLYLTKKYLTDAGYSVAATDDAARGAEIASKAKPAVITIDLDSLGEDAELIERITRSHNDGIIIAFSADAAAEKRAMQAGAGAVLRKPVERAALIGALERARTPSPCRVLVVDDDPDALDLAVAMLEGTGYEIQTAINGREALDAIAGQRPDAIILDLMLPEMDGFEVVHRMSVSPEWRTIPVILLTARDLSHEERRALDIGTARIIQKGSFSRDELLAELKTAIGAGEGDGASTGAD